MSPKASEFWRVVDDNNYVVSRALSSEKVANEISEMMNGYTAQAARINELEAMLRTVLSIPAVGDIETRIDQQGFHSANPITDARNMVALKASA